MKYRKKPVVIEAYQTDKELDIETLEGTIHASVGDYIITGVRGEKYPCKPDIFEQTYEPADTPASPWHRVEDDPPDGKEDVIFDYKWTGISGTVYRETSIISLNELIAFGCRPIQSVYSGAEGPDAGNRHNASRRCGVPAREHVDHV